MWAHSALPAECHPDIVTMAKPLANGYPIGAVLIRDNVAKTMTAGEFSHHPEKQANKIIGLQAHTARHSEGHRWHAR